MVRVGTYMAIIKIGNIKVTPELAISYVVNDKKSEKSNENNMKIHKNYLTALNCNINNAAKDWETVRKYYGKNNQILMFHVKQNFGLEVDPYIANEIGYRLANELFSNFQCIVATHSNTPYTHNHIIFNSVSFMDGKKFNATLGSYKKLREVSDKLCVEYGLPILEKTKNCNLIKYTDCNGKIKFFEPTERKEEIRTGKLSTTNDYRNTPVNDKLEAYKKTNREVIKSDIDKLLPTAKSYDDLLEKLKQIGYKIRAKKVNGEWVMHVSFKAPTQNKFTRDDKIGEQYTRENLSITIERDNIKNSKTDIDIIDNEIDLYQHGRIIIEDIDEDYKKKKSKNSNDYEKIIRSEVEKIIIMNTKKLDQEYRDSIKIQREKSEPTLKNKRNQFLLDCINANLKALNFVENKNIQSLKQINIAVSELCKKRNMIHAELDKIRNALKLVDENIAMINNYNSLKKKMLGDDYIKLDIDKSLIYTYETILTNRGLIDPMKQVEFKTVAEKYNESFNKITNSLRAISEQIKEYDDCVYTIDRVDKISNQQYTDEIKSYHESKNEHSNERSNENKNEQNHSDEQNKGHEDR